MSFITPMLAAAMPKTPLNITPGKYIAEEKFDGHRLIVERSEVPLNGTAVITAWSRDGKVRLLPFHLVTALVKLPNGIYDGELIAPEGKSHNVTELTQASSLVYVIFDVLELLRTNTIMQPWTERRAYLEEIFKRPHIQSRHLRLSLVVKVNSFPDVNQLLADMFAMGKEGLIVKRIAARYSPGKRPKEDWIKLKGLKTAVLTVIGFQASKGTIMNRGPYAVTVLRDDDGVETQVKTIDDAQCRAFEAEAPVDWMDGHPAIGRRLRIEYQEKIGANYRHPRWDRWAEEGE
jgi:ATP-dependent DNA ligase